MKLIQIRIDREEGFHTSYYNYEFGFLAHERVNSDLVNFGYNHRNVDEEDTDWDRDGFSVDRSEYKTIIEV